MTTTPFKKLKKLKYRKVTQPQDVAYPELEYMLGAYDRAKQAATTTAMESFALAQKIIDFMRSKKIGKYTHGTYTADIRQAHPEVVDWEGIRGVVPADKWQQILGEPQPVKSKLEALIELGVIDGDLIAPFVTTKENKPYVDLRRNI